MRRWIFPLHELYISAAIIIALVVAAYFLLGAWGGVLLWGVGALFSMSLAGLPFMCLFEARYCFRADKFAMVAGLLLGALLTAALWLGALGYCAWRAYQAVP